MGARVCVVGASGYAGVELCRLVVGHPEFALAMATDRKLVGTPLAEVYPALLGVTDIAFELPDPDVIAQKADVAFLAVPHTAALGLAPQLLERGVTVVDLSADYRIHDASVYEAWYDATHTSTELLKEAVYGLPELHRAELAQLAARREAGAAVLVAAPGCYPTATLLAATPALRAGIVAGDTIVSSAISGVSGAGRTPGPRTHYCHANESVEAYGVAAHRHTPEIEQELTLAAGRDMGVIFVPHLAPLTRGLLATVYLELVAGTTAEQVAATYEAAYAEEPLVTVLPAGQMPATASVAGSGRAQIGFACDLRKRPTLIVSSAIDNLGKGAAAQALQAANVVLGLPETAGLDFAAPVV